MKDSVSAPDIVCFGAAFLDELYTFRANPVQETSNPARLKRAWGGVARNVAQHLAQLGLKVELITQIGTDPSGQELEMDCRNWGIGLQYALRKAAPTGRFTAFLDPDGSLLMAATVTELESELSPLVLENILKSLPKARIWMADANLSAEALNVLGQHAMEQKISLIVDPVSVPKSLKIKSLNPEAIELICPNLEEAKSISGIEGEPEELARNLLDLGFGSVWIRLGEKGSLFKSANEEIRLPAKPVEVLDSTGAGDSALAAFLFGMQMGQDVKTCLEWGHRLAAEVLQTEGANLPTLRPRFFENPS